MRIKEITEAAMSVGIQGRNPISAGARGLMAARWKYDKIVDAASNNTYYAQLSSSGVGSWRSGTAYPGNVSTSACVERNDYIYCIGGQLDTWLASNGTYYTQILPDGNIGDWTASTP